MRAWRRAGAGQLNCAIDSHSTGHVGASLALLLLHFLHSHAATSCVIWPCSVFIVLLCCVGKCHRSGTPSQCFVILGNEWVCHLVIGDLSPWNCQYLSRVFTVFLSVGPGLLGQHIGTNIILYVECRNQVFDNGLCDESTRMDNVLFLFRNLS